MINVLKKINTVVTIVGTVYTVTKFMYKTFKKYEEKHGNFRRKQKNNDNGTRVQEDI